MTPGGSAARPRCPASPGVHPVIARADDDGESRERPQLLERARHPQAAYPIRREAGERGAVQAHLPGVGAIEAADDLEERRLAGPVRADDADQLAGRHVEGDVAVRGDASEPLGDARDGEQAHDVDPAAGRRLNRSPTQGSSPWGANRIITTRAVP